MRTEPIFKSLSAESQGSVTIVFDGQPYTVSQGISVAAALILVGAESTRRTPVTNAPRAPYCMMGVCFECLVEIDGRASVQSCLVEVAEGMQVRSQSGAAAFAAEPAEVSV